MVVDADVLDPLEVESSPDVVGAGVLELPEVEPSLDVVGEDVLELLELELELSPPAVSVPAPPPPHAVSNPATTIPIPSKCLIGPHSPGGGTYTRSRGTPATRENALQGPRGTLPSHFSSNAPFTSASSSGGPMALSGDIRTDPWHACAGTRALITDARGILLR
ncbi:hypothetical protein [Nannocystis radixulma]|uniref:Uncharacterized protein n=1 Tax=Nannocystis radixulma TaxID=2995305 RepID=A0ABT5B2K7_9BACT|nr:hypothetical protein [Nannocystis radixulma]MDC0667372.1 hypothetical protein [Nannocystis radixulma]